ncbi:MAG: DUF4874 domain-containing protein [Clostridiales bacterium]|nr:DUF4874 domain-containing protein [Clostridiales bacterium]
MMNPFFNELPALQGVCSINPLPHSDERKLFGNPDRGLRHQIDFIVLKNPPEEDPAAMMNRADALVAAHVDYFAGVHPTLSQSYVYLTDFKDTKVLPDMALEQVEAFLSAHRKYGIRALLRFTYQTEMDGTGEASEEVMTAHMQQLFPLVAKHIDVIHVYQAGFLGAWGEWHSNQLPVDRKRLLENILAACPESLFIQMRLPDFKNLIEEGDPRRERLSHHNDSVFGAYSPASGGVDPGTEQTKQVERESPYLPIDGELFWGGWSRNKEAGGYFPDPFLVIKWLFEQRYTSLSVMHNYMELGPTTPLAMRLWQNVEMPLSFLKENGMPIDPAYFTDDQGNNIRRSAFDYLRDHLGYRLKAQTLAVQGRIAPNETIELALTVNNMGFAAPHMLCYARFVLLNEAGEEIGECPLGSLAKWYNRDPIHLDNREIMTHTANGKLTLPDKAGCYYLGFAACNNAGTAAALANDTPFVNGINLLGAIEIK